MVYEVRFVLARRLPFRRLTSGHERLPVVEPEFHHPIVIGRVFISADDKAVALDQSAEVRNTSTQGSVDIFPVMKELFVG